MTNWNHMAVYFTKSLEEAVSGGCKIVSAYECIVHWYSFFFLGGNNFHSKLGSNCLKECANQIICAEMMRNPYISKTESCSSFKVIFIHPIYRVCRYIHTL